MYNVLRRVYSCTFCTCMKGTSGSFIFLKEMTKRDVTIISHLLHRAAIFVMADYYKLGMSLLFLCKFWCATCCLGNKIANHVSFLTPEMPLTFTINWPKLQRTWNASYPMKFHFMIRSFEILEPEKMADVFGISFSSSHCW